MHLFQVGAGSGGMAVLDLVARDPRVTRVTLVEPDVYAPHNVHRHIFPPSAVGRLKAELAAEWLRAIRHDLAVEALVADITDPSQQAEFARRAAECDIGICAADNEAAKFAFDALMRAAGKPWTLGEVLSGGIGGWVHRFTPGGACYGCVASHLQREVTEQPSGPPPDYSDPNAAHQQATIPASKASIAVIAGLHAMVTLEMLEEPNPPTPFPGREGGEEAESLSPPSLPGKGVGGFGSPDFTSLLFSLAVVPGVFDAAFRPHRLRIPRSPTCLTCGAPAHCLKLRTLSMPQWTTRWLAWARDNLFRRARPRPLSAAVGYERAGAARWEAPVPWTADAVVVDVLLRLPVAARKKGDFALRLPFATFPADALRPDLDDRHRVTFRFPVPLDTVRGDLLWRGHVLATLPVPVLTPASFLAGLALTNPTVSVRLGAGTVAATAFVPAGCGSLVAVTGLRCYSPLAPLAELGLKAVFHDETTGTSYPVPVALSAAQLAGREAVAAAVCPEVPRRPGGWWVTWVAGDRTLATQRVQAITADRFEAGVRLVETRFAVVDPGGAVRTVKVPPSLVGAEQVGPCFVLQGLEAGAAGVCRFEVTGVSAGEPDPVLWRAAEALVTDAPTVFVPALFDAPALAHVSGFELRLNGRLLGVASLRPVPAAAINGEGGFTPPTDFAWSSAADDELADRLKRLQG